MENTVFVYMIHTFVENPNSKIFEFSHIHPVVFASAELAEKFIEGYLHPCSKDVLYSIFKMNMIKE